MVSWLLTSTAALGAITGLSAVIATANPAQVQVLKPAEDNPTKAYQQICQAEARHQGAPAAVAHGSCRCLQQRLNTLDQPPRTLEELRAFTEKNQLACVFQAILEL
ncbi:MAG: hypothetical protein OXF67_02190 [Cyanobacteria bacterium MAG CAR4_bin_6]|nr:hypothetical protein [Cyanobacteria bacterium MAG CAR4_bin_6]